MWMLVIWFIFSFVVPWFAKELNSLSFLGFPLGYYMIVQGSLIVFVVQIFFQNWKQRSEEHTSELQSLMRISYAVFCLKKKIKTNTLDKTYVLIHMSLYKLI